jgi:DNA-binding MurR/RpiR family transcriptional regulator
MARYDVRMKNNEIQTFSDFEKLVRSEFTDLSPQLQHAARYSLDHPDDIALLSMRAVASRATVQPATMIRLARRLSFPSYNEYRALFSDRLRNGTNGFVERARYLQSHKSARGAAGIVIEAFEADVGNLTRSLGTVVEPLAHAARLIEGARHVYIIGRRTCYSAAFLLQYSYRMFRDNSTLLDDHGAGIEDALIGMDKHDVLIAISVEPYSRETVNAVSHAIDAGANVVAITDSPVSPLARQAKYAIIVADKGPSFFQSITAAVATAQALIAILVAEGGKRTMSSLDASEAHLMRLGAYWHEGKKE